MAKASVLLGSYEEAAEMLAEQGINVSVNQLRNVTAGMGNARIFLLEKRVVDDSSFVPAGTPLISRWLSVLATPPDIVVVQRSSHPGGMPQILR